jgi:hypothetical protein
MVNKKAVLALAALILVSGLAFGQSYANDGMLIQPGSINVNAGIGYGYYSLALDIGGGAEFAIGKFMIGETLPFTYGLAARVGFAIGYANPLSLGAFGTLHFCWDALGLVEDFPWLSNLDSYLGLGLTFMPGIWFNSIGGFNYFLNEHLAINLETGIRSSYVGILFKL